MGLALRFLRSSPNVEPARCCTSARQSMVASAPERRATRAPAPGAPAPLGLGDFKLGSGRSWIELVRLTTVFILVLAPLGCERTSTNNSAPEPAPPASNTAAAEGDSGDNESNEPRESGQEPFSPQSIDEAAHASRQTASPHVDTPVTATMPVVETNAIEDAPISSSGNAVAYKPGITLNYEALQVEVDAQVILRQGELELLLWAESPTPKGHETILATKAKPSDIYEALGLMGLTPGSPPWFDFKKSVAHAAQGDAVEVRVRYQRNGQTIEHNICDWLTNKARQAPMKRRDWVFCGSRREENGRFAADFEGTVITVVDFPSSLLSLAESHSESNAELWLVANAERIPEIDTPVTVILRAVESQNEQ